jgi:hypothetical protein
VALADQDTCVVKGFRKALLEDQGLQAAGHKIRNLDTKNVIQLALVLIQKSQTHAAPKKSRTLEDTLRALLIKSEELTSVLPHLSEQKLDTPNLALVLQAELSDNLHLTVETLLLERPTRGLRCLGVCSRKGIRSVSGRPRSISRSLFPSEMAHAITKNFGS